MGGTIEELAVSTRLDASQQLHCLEIDIKGNVCIPHQDGTAKVIEDQSPTPAS
jgi:hypothetical protein